MAASLKGDVVAEVYGEAYTLRFGGAAMMVLEQSMPGRDILSILRDLSRADQPGIAGTPVTDAAKLTHAALRLHHPELSLDEAAELAMVDNVQVALGEAIQASMPVNKGGDGNAAADPPKPRRRSPRKTS